MSDIMKLVGKRVREIRIARGLSQEQLAEKAGTQYTYISALETGKRNLTISTLAVIAEKLDVEIVELFTFASEDGTTAYEAQLENLISILKSLNPKELKLAGNILREIIKNREE